MTAKRRLVVSTGAGLNGVAKFPERYRTKRNEGGEKPSRDIFVVFLIVCWVEREDAGGICIRLALRTSESGIWSGRGLNIFPQPQDHHSSLFSLFVVA